MNSYIEIDRLFGTPLNQVPKPKVPFKIKPWHIITAGTVLVAAVYGIYTFCNDVKSKFSYKEDDSSKNNSNKFTPTKPSTLDNREESLREENKKIIKTEKYSVKIK